jgi:hypothetical protein
MRNSMVSISRSVLLMAVLCAATATAAVPTEVSVSGKVTGLTSQSIQIDGVAYPIESNDLTRAELADVRVGDSITVAVAGRVVSREIKVRVVAHAAHNNRD